MSMPMQSGHLQNGLQGLRDGFLERVTTRCLSIEAILADAASSGAEVMATPDRAAIQQHAHKTAGVAATFGYADMGAKALEVERIMAQHGGDLPWSAIRPAVEALLDEMEVALDEAA